MLKITVKLYAQRRGLNRNQLQLMSGVTLPLLNRYWNNITTEIKLDALERIAKALNESPGDLIMTEAEILKKFGMEGWQALNEQADKDAA